MSEMPIDQLDLKRAMAGDERAMQRLWSQHAPHIDAVVRRLCDDAELAADISQEVWMQIFRALPSYRGESQFGTWAHRIAVNRTLNALRKIRRIAKLEVDIEDDSATTENESDRTFLAESIEGDDQAFAWSQSGIRASDIEGYTHENRRGARITRADRNRNVQGAAKLRKLSRIW